MACLGWHSEAGAHQDVDPRPWHLSHSHGPTAAPGGLEDGGGTWCQAAEAGMRGCMAPCATAPQAPRPGSIHRPPSCRHIRPSPDINPHQGPCSLFLFCPPLPSPTHVFFSLLSLFQHVITVETKSAGTMRALTRAPSRPPPPTVRASTLSTRPGLEPLPKEPC